jgi:luciferase family oxidoreductase group 1
MGYTRIWLAEHHGVPGIATGAPAVLMAAVAAATGRIRVGSAGVMIPNHRPLIVAEQARALQALFPGRIDLGIGRSLGFTAPVRAALGATEYDLDDMERDLRALRDFFDDAGPVRAMPTGEPVPMFVLATGSGLAVAARRGLPVIVGGPILRGDLAPLEDYRRDFVPSAEHPEPAVLISVDVTVGPTADRARDWLLPEAWAMVASRTVGAFPPLEDVTPDSLAAKGLTDRQERWVRRHLDNARRANRRERGPRLLLHLRPSRADVERRGARRADRLGGVVVGGFVVEADAEGPGEVIELGLDAVADGGRPRLVLVEGVDP